MSARPASRRLQPLPAAERVMTPWKNGGGLTGEIAVHPPAATLEDFDWRISCAQVAAHGPFSRFPGIDRVLVILEGELALAVAGGPALVLTPESAPCAFPGDAAASAGPVAGTVHDLNVMTRRGRCAARVQRCLVKDRAKFSFTTATTVVLASANLVLHGPERPIKLGRMDALRIEGRLDCEFSSVVPGACFHRIEITHTARAG